MALPIEETPELSGIDAWRFIDNIRNRRETRPEVDFKKVEKFVMERMANRDKPKKHA